MKRLLIVLLIPIIALFGCNANVDKHYKEEISSAIEEENIFEQQYANRNGFYVFDNKKGVLQQWAWDKGTMIAEYENLEMEKLLLVTDRYIYFQVMEEGSKPSRVNNISVFCIPIQDKKGIDIINEKEKKEIFTVQAASEGIYKLSKYGNQIICLTNDSQIFLFNESRKELETIQEDMGSLNFANYTAASVFEGSVYFTDDKTDGLYKLDLKENTKRLERVNNCYVNSFVCDKNAAFYSVRGEEQNEPIIYSLQKNEPCLKYADIAQMLSSFEKRKRGTKVYHCIDIDIYVFSIFENRLYFSVEFGYEPYGVDLREKVLLSVNINDFEDVCVEEKLNNFLAEIYECNDGVESKGNILEVISGKCLVMGEKGKKFEDSLRIPYIYDLKSGENKRLSKKDAEWWYCYYYYNYPMD